LATYCVSLFFVEPQLLTLNKTKVGKPLPIASQCLYLMIMLGEHDFSWAILPHEGHFIQSDVAEAAYIYNSPLHGMLLLSDIEVYNADSFQ
jgi:alpha-mannosidase